MPTMLAPPLQPPPAPCGLNAKPSTAGAPPPAPTLPPPSAPPAPPIANMDGLNANAGCDGIPALPPEPPPPTAAANGGSKAYAFLRGRCPRDGRGSGEEDLCRSGRGLWSGVPLREAGYCGVLAPNGVPQPWGRAVGRGEEKASDEGCRDNCGLRDRAGVNDTLAAKGGSGGWLGSGAPTGAGAGAEARRYIGLGVLPRRPLTAAAAAAAATAVATAGAAAGGGGPAPGNAEGLGLTGLPRNGVNERAQRLVDAAGATPHHTLAGAAAAALELVEDANDKFCRESTRLMNIEPGSSPGISVHTVFTGTPGTDGLGLRLRRRAGEAAAKPGAAQAAGA